MYAFAIKSMVKCGSAFEPGASELPYYCSPPVCVPAVIGALAVWRQNNTKKKHVFSGLKIKSVRAKNKINLFCPVAYVGRGSSLIVKHSFAIKLINT